MRFIINFFIYGFIFFLIYLFFPEAFTTLVSWAGKVYDFFAGIIQSIKEKTGGTPTKPAEEAHKAMAYLLGMLHS